VGTVASELAAFAVARRAQPLPAPARHGAVRAVVDWVSAVVPGSVLPPPQILAEAVATGTGVARLVPSGRPAEARTAALLNGTAAHAAELDDIYRDALYHPGAPTVAAALAAAEHADAAGPDLLRAITIGYEVGARVALAVAPAHYRNWHPTGTAGTIGAAAAAAEILQLDGLRFAHALAIATTMTAGLQQTIRTGSMSKPLHAGHAAEAGMLAAFAASRGLTGSLDALEGPAGFGVATAGITDLRVGGLGQPFCVTETTVKCHACCGHAFAAIDAALELRAGGVRAEDVTSVEIETYRVATEVAGHPDPAGPEQARFSLAYTVAAALVLGSVRLGAFTPEALANPEIRRLTAGTVVRADPGLDALAPRRRAARVRLTGHRGDRAERLRLTRKGDPDDPLSDAELRAKYDELVVPFLGAQRAASIARTLWDLPALPRVRGLDWG
jgi:2-methylcitrate dehydratase PrpD